MRPRALEPTDRCHFAQLLVSKPVDSAPSQTLTVALCGHGPTVASPLHVVTSGALGGRVVSSLRVTD